MSARSTPCADVVSPEIVPLNCSESSSFKVPLEIVIVLEPAVPPLAISSVPPLRVAPATMPPDDTSSVPPVETTVLDAVPPENTHSAPHEDTTALEVVPPESKMKPAEPTLVLLATPPDSTTCSAPPPCTKVPLAMAVLLTYSTPPANTVAALAEPKISWKPPDTVAPTAVAPVSTCCTPPVTSTEALSTVPAFTTSRPLLSTVTEVVAPYICSVPPFTVRLLPEPTT